jgi:hypothetical protein
MMAPKGAAPVIPVLLVEQDGFQLLEIEKPLGFFQACSFLEHAL